MFTVSSPPAPVAAGVLAEEQAARELPASVSKAAAATADVKRDLLRFDIETLFSFGM
jgi:hypothetical protein